MKVKCFDIVSMVTEEATSQFAPLWKVNTEKQKVLEQYCEALDELAEEFDGESFEVDVDDIKMTIAITMECEDMTIESSSHKFYALAQRAIALQFFASDDDLLGVRFTFPSIWDKV